MQEDTWVICDEQMIGVRYLRLLKVCLQYPGQHLLQHSLRLQALILLAPEGEAASEHAVQQNATGPDVCHLASILVVQQHLWSNIFWCPCSASHNSHSSYSCITNVLYVCLACLAQSK